MKFISFVVVSYVFALLSSCNPVGQNQNNGNQLVITPSSQSNVGDDSYKPRKTEKPEQVLIYCDLTTSIKQDGIIQISDKLKQVLLHLPRNSVANVRLLGKNLLVDSPFPEILAPSACDKSESEVKRIQIEAQEECKKNDQIYIKKVENISARIKILKPQIDVSCIIDTLEAASDFFKGKDKGKYSFRLIYFSDMIEQCTTNSIFICSSKKQPKKADILAKIETGFNPTYNLETLIGNNISLIITTDENPSYKCLPLSEQKEIWTKVFAKTGYSNADLSVFNYTQEIPDSLKITN